MRITFVQVIVSMINRDKTPHLLASFSCLYINKGLFNSSFKVIQVGKLGCDYGDKTNLNLKSKNFKKFVCQYKLLCTK